MKRTLTTFTLVMAALLLRPHSGQAQTNIAVTFDSLPSSHGWTYFQADGVPEAGVFSANGTALIQNTIGSGFGNGSSPNYALFGVVDGAEPFALAVRARVLASEGSAFGFSFAVRTATPNQNYAIGFTTSSVIGSAGNTVALDTTVFHDYLLTATPGSNYSLYIDGQLRLVGPFDASGGALNALQIGDGNNLGANAHAEVTQYVLSQSAIFNPPPVLSCSPGFLPPFDVAIGPKRKQQRTIPVKMTLHDSTGSIITDASIVAPVVNVEFTAAGGTGGEET